MKTETEDKVLWRVACSGAFVFASFLFSVCLWGFIELLHQFPLGFWGILGIVWSVVGVLGSLILAIASIAGFVDA